MILEEEVNNTYFPIFLREKSRRSQSFDDLLDYGITYFFKELVSGFLGGISVFLKHLTKFY